LARGAVAGGVPSDSEALVQRSTLVEHAAQPPKVLKGAGMGMGMDIHSAEDILKYLEDMRRMQESLGAGIGSENDTEIVFPPHVKGKSKSKFIGNATSANWTSNFDLMLDETFVLGDVLRVSAKWGVKLVVQNCTIDVGFVPRLGVYWQLKGPVVDVQDGLKIDWMPPQHLLGGYSRLVIDTDEDDKIWVHGMCAPVPILGLQIIVCLDWQFDNLGGCDYDRWEVGVRAIFVGHNNVPFPFKGLIPSLPTPFLKLGVIEPNITSQ